MYDYFAITLNQMVVLFVFMLIGFLTRRKNLAPKMCIRDRNMELLQRNAG